MAYTLVPVVDPADSSLDLSLVKIATKQASAIIEAINKRFPMEGYRYLKRIKRVRGEDSLLVLLARMEAFDTADLQVELQAISVINPVISTVAVSAHAARTKAQFDFWNLTWPLVFFESLNERTITANQQLHNDIFNLCCRYFCENSLGFMVYDVLELKDFDRFEPDRVVFEVDSVDDRCGSNHFNFPMDHLTFLAMKTYTSGVRKTRSGNIPYLLNGCIAIYRTEPCIMCAMALLHSRIDAIIYLNGNEKAGSLGSICQLNSMNHLNHKFPVYKAIKAE